MKSKKHTTERSSENKSFNCPICKDTGWALKSIEGQYDYYGECVCGLRQKQILESKKSFANIPETFKYMRLKDFRTDIYTKDENKVVVEKSVKAIQYWLENIDTMRNRGMGLYIASNAKGSGKTRMAASVANELVEKGISTLFATSVSIITEIKTSWEKDSANTENQLLNDLSRADVLVIDDFGTERESGWVNEKFYQIINNRYVGKKITIFTSNSRLNDLRYDERIKNRIKETTFQVPFPEESVRDIIAKENMEELLRAIR